MEVTNVTKMWSSKISGVSLLFKQWVLAGLLLFIGTTVSVAQGPNCTDVNASLNADGDINIALAEFLTNSATVGNVNYTVYNQYDGPVVSGTDVDPLTEVLDFNACSALRYTYKVQITAIAGGSCWSNLTFKQSNGPVIASNTYYVYCLDPVVADIGLYLDRFYGDFDGKYEPYVDDKYAIVPCRDSFPADFVADWIDAYPCDPGSDTAKILYREFEAFDKDGNRGYAFDTLVVYRLPEITMDNIYCSEKDTTYCGVADNYGPYMVVSQIDSSTGMVIPMECDTLYFTTSDESEKCAIASPALFDPKCGINVHVSCWEFPDPCSPQYKVTIDIKQTCYSDDLDGTCVVTPAADGPGTPNAFEEVAPGYWRCEYWVIDLDTLEPFSQVKYDKLQSQNVIPSTYSPIDDHGHVDEYHCFETPRSPDFTDLGHYQPLIVVPTTTHDCAGHTYIPPLCVYDEWSEVKQVKARFIDYHTYADMGTIANLNIGTYVATAAGEPCEFQYPSGPEHANLPKVGECYEFHDAVKLPKSEYPYMIMYEVVDNCHNIDTIFGYMLIKDRTRPVAVADKGVTVSLGSKKVWVDATTFDEGSWDNCNVNFLLARRTDWYEACVDLCDSTVWCCEGPHGDRIYKPYLEEDKHVDEVEAYYAKTLQWLWDDGQECSSIIYNAWLYDLMKYATLECVDHPYPVDDEYFRNQFEECYYYYLSEHSSGSPADSKNGGKEVKGPKFNDLDPGPGFKYCFDYFHEIPDHPGFGCENGNGMMGTAPAPNGGLSHESVSKKVDLYSQIGGGWAEAVPFDCDDACGPVTVEILVMDYWCNWSKAWTEVWVEDKTPVTVAKDVVDVEITCNTYKTAKYGYGDELHPVSLEYIVSQAEAGEQTAFDSLDAILGGYCKAWVDPYGNYVDEYGVEIDCDITFNDYRCTCVKRDTQIRVYDDHLGYIWKDSVWTDCYYLNYPQDLYKGIVAVNCATNVQCEQDIWVDIDHCGQGVIYRKWKVWQGCPPQDGYGSGHVPDTIVRHQRIYLGNECELNKYMFDVPGDTTVVACGITYDPDGSGNVAGEAGPEYTGYPYYKFDDDCRLVGIAHEDKVFKIVGGDEGCYKIVRTWYFADWCEYGEPAKKGWYRGGKDKYIYCEQKILVIDTVPPVCVITGPTEEGGIIEAAGCDYNFSATVDVTDSCGLIEYYWELKDITDDADHVLVDSDAGELEDGSDNFTIEVAGLTDGYYKLKSRVTDECQNESYCEYTFWVATGKKPAAICITSLTANLVPWDTDSDGIADTAAAVVWAYEFNSSSSAPCGYDSEDLEYYIEFLGDDQGDDTLNLESNDSLGLIADADSLPLGCGDIGTHTVRMWVLSPTGSADYCDVLLIVQNNMGGCGDISGAAVSGVITTEKEQSVEQVQVTAKTADGATLNGVTTGSGAYSFATSLGIDVTVTPKKDIEADNGVTTLDLVKIQKHILGKALLETELKEIAADANVDGKITPLDLLEIRKLILGKNDKFSNVDSWRFFNQIDNEESYTISGINGQMVLNWTGVKIGDVNNSNDPSRSASRSGKSLVFDVSDAQVIAGNQYKVDFKANNFSDITGYQFTLNFNNDAINVLNVESGALEVTADNFGLNRIEDGMMTTSWNAGEGMSIAQGEVVFSLIVEAKTAAELSDVMTVNSRVTAAEAYNSADQIHDVSLNFGGSLAETGFALYQNEPNPFKASTTVGFNLPASMSASVTVYDVTGKVLKVVDGDYVKGYNEVTFKRSDLNTTGVLYYQLDTEAFTATKKMIVIE